MTSTPHLAHAEPEPLPLEVVVEGDQDQPVVGAVLGDLGVGDLGVADRGGAVALELGGVEDVLER